MPPEMFSYVLVETSCVRRLNSSLQVRWGTARAWGCRPRATGIIAYICAIVSQYLKDRIIKDRLSTALQSPDGIS
jgi:hypothetical protein